MSNSSFSPNLLSVVVRHHSLARLSFLDEAVFSLACQYYQPLEIVVASQCNDAAAPAALQLLLKKHQGLASFSFKVLHYPSAVDIRSHLLNEGIKNAGGQYLAFLDDDDVVYPHHYQTLIGALKKGDAAWAAARARRAFYRVGPDGALWCRLKEAMPDDDDYSLRLLVQNNFITLHSYVLDRARLSSFALHFDEGASRFEDYLFLLRLAASHAPLYLKNVGCEYRLREDGSNTVIVSGLSDEQRQEEAQKWESARLYKEAAKTDIYTQLSLANYEKDLRQSFADGFSSGEKKAWETFSRSRWIWLQYKALRKLKGWVKNVAKKLLAAPRSSVP